ncbi:heavy-metal-associated domain-containing protein [Paraburkholderia aromaticivorans]|uniref:heavy-metal-associated domain-containing protein n=1 Tax=Paraburkholderia aromaticivorans TaxID=2026199 RepID=UPI0038B879BA
METLIFDIGGMKCGGCVNGVQRTLDGLDGVSDVEVRLTPGQATLHVDASRVSSSQIQAAITPLGYSARERAGGAAERQV